MIQDYFYPQTVTEALSLLSRYPRQARVFAGGTDLILEGEADDRDIPAFYIDPSRIPELDGIYLDNGELVIGANVTHAQAATHPLVLRYAPALAKACGSVGSQQIRNTGTLAGNVVTANPAADAAVALTALEARCVIKSIAGQRETPLPDMYAGVGYSSLDSGAELLICFRLPLPQASEGNAYERISLRNALSLPMLNVAVQLGLENGLIRKAVIVAGPLAPGPSRITLAEQSLIGKEPQEEHFLAAGELASQHVRFRSSAVRCSAEYRHEVLPVLICRALTEAADLAKKGELA